LDSFLKKDLIHKELKIKESYKIFKNLSEILREKYLIYGYNLKSSLFFIFSRLMRKGKVLPKVPLATFEKNYIDKKSKFMMNLNIFTIFSNIKKTKIRHSTFVFHYIKKYFLLSSRLSDTYSFNKINEVSSLGLKLIFNSKNLLLKYQDQLIDFDIFLDWKIFYVDYIIDLIFGQFDDEEEDIIDNEWILKKMKKKILI